MLVVGDLMLDRYLWGEVERISPEAPVPIVRLSKETDRLGGAGNVASNLAGLGVEVTLAGYVGADGAGAALQGLLVASNIDASGVVEVMAAATITKTRVIGGHQQMLRLDQDPKGDLPDAARSQLVEGVKRSLVSRKPSALVLSDYAKGCLSAEVCQGLIAAAKAAGVPVFVDPKGLDFRKYRGATCLTPNKREAAAVCGVPHTDSEAVLSGMARLRREYGLDYVLLTRGEEGMSLIADDGPHHFPASAQQVYDVSGAGDTAIAVFAASVAAGVDLGQACQLANAAAGVVVGRVGTSPIGLAELEQALQQQDTALQAGKILAPAAARKRVEDLHAAGRTVVFTNGCFDLLHAGHVTYLESARREGDALIVGLNTDRSIRALKGPSRPVIHEEDRARVLAALESVDGVVLFDEDTPLELIELLRPDVLVKGDDYTEDQVVGAREVKSWGGRVALMPVLPGRSTSRIVDQLNATEPRQS